MLCVQVNISSEDNYGFNHLSKNIKQINIASIHFNKPQKEEEAKPLLLRMKIRVEIKKIEIKQNRIKSIH